MIKIEPPRPDVSRFAHPAKPGISGYYAQQNSGKRNISIDLNVEGAREIALRLCDEADVIVENFRARTLASFGLDYRTIASRNPRVIYASITGYGQGGLGGAGWPTPRPSRPKTDLRPTASGTTAKTFRAQRTDSLSHADVYTGLQATIAILAALHGREKTGKGQHIDVAMAATLMAIAVFANAVDDHVEPARQDARKVLTLVVDRRRPVRRAP